MWSLSLLLLCVSAGSAFVNSGFLPNFGSQQSSGSWSNSSLWHNNGTTKKPSSFDTWDFTVNGQRYRLAGLQNGKTWSSARLHCKSLSMDLVVIDSEYLNKQITQTLNGLGMSVKMGAWIGLTDIQREGQFKNLCNRAPTYTAWDRNQPDNNYGSADCVVIKNVFGVGKWSDEVCTTWRPFVCGPRTSSNCKTPTTTLSTSTIGSKCEDSLWPCTFLHCLSETGRGYCAKTCSSCGAATASISPTTTSAPTSISPTTTTSATTSISPTTTTSATISSTVAPTTAAPTTPTSTFGCVDQLASNLCEQAKKALGCGKDMKLYCSATCGTCSLSCSRSTTADSRKVSSSDKNTSSFAPVTPPLPVSIVPGKSIPSLFVPELFVLKLFLSMFKPLNFNNVSTAAASSTKPPITGSFSNKVSVSRRTINVPSTFSSSSVAPTTKGTLGVPISTKFKAATTTITLVKSTGVTLRTSTVSACTDQLPTEDCLLAKQSFGCGDDVLLYCTATCAAC